MTANKSNGIVRLKPRISPSAWLVLFFGINCFLPRATFPEEFPVPAHFDFGPTRSAVDAGAIAVDQHTIYAARNGYGLLAPADRDFSSPELKILGDLIADGVGSDHALAFRVDLAPGRYWIELFMAGGKFSAWQGEIRANHHRLANTLYKHGDSFEGEEPPPYWALLRRVEVTGDSLIVRVAASNQVSTLLGLSIYRDELGPLRFQQGTIIPANPLRAPNADLTLRLINRGRIREAQTLIEAIPERPHRLEKAGLLLALAGRLEVDEPRPLIEWAARLLRQESTTEPSAAVALNLRLAELYLQADDAYKLAGWDWARLATGAGIFTRLDLAGRAFEEIAQATDHPLYHRAVWQLGKLSFWDWIEQHGRRQKLKADECFAILQPYYPEHRLLRMYMGEQLPHQEASTDTNQTAPLWAATAQRALNGLLEVIHYWVDNRQAENGEFGGKYDDDVEMLRWWPIARLAADDEKTLLGLRRLVDGIWQSNWIENGFSRKIRDVEHAAEPVADTQPMMIGLDYGNPIYVERCMESIKGLRDLWTGINRRGHRHFKSSWYSATALDVRPPRDCDVPMNTRTVKAARWLAWYNRHPFAMQFLREWGDAWLEDCLRTDKGKPYGVVPAAIRFEDDAIGGHADNWHHPEMFWQYYNFRGGTRMLLQFLATYALTGDSRYLEPIESALKIVAEHSATDTREAPVGSEAWVAEILSESSGFAQTIEQWRLLTGDSRFDEVVSKVGSDYLKFRLTGDKRHLVAGSQHIVDGTHLNRELITTEAYFTDRIYIGNLHDGRHWGASHLESMYTGSSLVKGFYPFYTVSWKGLGPDFVAVVLNSGPERVVIQAVNLAGETRQGRLSFWALAPGTYEFLQGPDGNDDGIMDAVSIRDEFAVQSRSASHEVGLPSQSLQIIEARQIQPAPESLGLAMADLAITVDEIEVNRNEAESTLEVLIPVHNIGIAEAANVVVSLVANGADGKEVLTLQTIDRISAPLDLQPRIVEIKISVPIRRIQNHRLSVVVDPKNRIPEITEINNRVVIPAGKFSGIESH